MERHTSQRRSSSLLLTFVGWSGWAAASSGVLFVVVGYVDREGAPWYLDLAVLVLSIVVPLLFLVGLAGLYVMFGPQAGWLSSIGFLFSFAAAGWATIEAVKHAPNLYRHIGERIWSTPPGAAQECGFCLQAKLSQLLSDPITWLLVGLSLVGIATLRQGLWRGWSLLLLAMALSGWVYQLTDDRVGLANIRSVHVAFGLLYSLGWMFLGYTLWQCARNNDQIDIFRASRRAKYER